MIGYNNERVVRRAWMRDSNATPRRSKVATKGFAKFALHNFIVLGQFNDNDFSSNFRMMFFKL